VAVADEGLPTTVGLGAPDTAASPRSSSIEEPTRGQSIGRFIVLRTLGIGGMGMVVSAYDPKLERTVALKLIRPDVAPTEGATGARARLLREAQAMAKLRHPNVVSVFEVGEFEGQVFLAMEHVPGTTLGEWAHERRREPRGWIRTVAAFVDAGRALVAAHALGMIHRDFKPANVLVEGDRVQVTDFGIASVGGRDRESVELVEASAEPAVRTGTGALIGTAPYMAPELLHGSPADEKTDQFAFCVALFEALYGKRPFAGHDVESWSRSITDGRIDRADDERGVPEWIRDAVLRGLASDPADRWSSMAQLVDTLAAPDKTQLGSEARIALSAAAGALFVALPFVAKALGPPFDRSTYRGVVGQSLSLIVSVLAMAYVYRDQVRATATNRKSFLGVMAVLVMQLPLELASAATGVPIAACDTLHLVLWAGMAAIFGATTDRRFFALAASYLVCLPFAAAWPEHVLFVLGVANLALFTFVLVIWRRNGPAPIALGA
jgi:serine/threonine protein kinase